jgi:pSer/pThr/pTyr-binding forkhead associated (FHA) protein
MLKLVLSYKGNIEREYPLNKERITIGRKPENDIQIDNLAISGRHALITTILDASFLEDLGSTNGTYVNGKLIKKHALKHGDEIIIGRQQFTYLNEAAAAREEDPEKTVLLSPGSARLAMGAIQAHAAAMAQTQRISQSPPPMAGVPLGQLRILNGPIAGKEIELSKAIVSLGKPGIQVATISRRPQGYFLSHVEGDAHGQPHYPMVNGESIGPEPRQLRNQDVIELAGIKMEFSILPPR